jgi:hypothetical protein
MPQEFDRLMENFVQRVPGVMIAVRAWKHDHTEFHRAESPLAHILAQRAAIFPLRRRNVCATENQGNRAGEIPGALQRDYLSSGIRRRRQLRRN